MTQLTCAPSRLVVRGVALFAAACAGLDDPAVPNLTSGADAHQGSEGTSSGVDAETPGEAIAAPTTPLA